jgi:hypothetical protein
MSKTKYGNTHTYQQSVGWLHNFVVLMYMQTNAYVSMEMQ